MSFVQKGSDSWAIQWSLLSRTTNAFYVCFAHFHDGIEFIVKISSFIKNNWTVMRTVIGGHYYLRLWVNTDNYLSQWWDMPAEWEHAHSVLACCPVTQQQRGAVEACWAHNPEVGGSKPLAANHFAFSVLQQVMLGVNDFSGWCFEVISFAWELSNRVLYAWPKLCMLQQQLQLNTSKQQPLTSKGRLVPD